jgi:hypothetical protein
VRHQGGGFVSLRRRRPFWGQPSDENMLSKVRDGRRGSGVGQGSRVC